MDMFECPVHRDGSNSWLLSPLKSQSHSCQQQLLLMGLYSPYPTHSTLHECTYTLTSAKMAGPIGLCIS